MDGSILSGKVESVDADRIVFAGQRSVPAERTKVKFVQYDIIRGKARARWTTGLLLAGAGVSLFLGGREVFGENGERGFVPAAIGLSTGGAAAGYAVGRSRDRRTTILKIEP
jgi:hypothetical protein